MRAALLLLLAVCAAALPTLGCESVKRAAWQIGLPFVSPGFDVDSVQRRVGFLDVRLSSGGVQRRIFAYADDPACAAMLVEGQTVSWARSEPFGPLSYDGARCSVVGLGDLERWRNARGRASTTTRPITTAETSFRIVHHDETHFYAIGGFSLAGLLGWTPGTDQVLAMMPISEVCVPADRNGRVSLEFRIAGNPALSVITPAGRCPIEAVMAAPRLEPAGVGSGTSD